MLDWMSSRSKTFVALAFCALVAAAMPAPTLSQPSPKVPRIGFMHTASAQVADEQLQAFRAGLRDLGYVEGKNIQLELRWADGDLERLPALAAELVRLNVDVIVAASSPTVLAARQATRTIPIVMPLTADPVGEGLVASLAHPGGNITGLSVMAPELGQKRLQLLKEVVPSVGHTTDVLWNPAYVGMRARFEQAQVAGPAVGLSVRSVEVRNVRELDTAFNAIARKHPEALVLLVDPFTRSQRSRIVEFAATQRLPAIYEASEFVEAGGLISYGPNIADQFRRAAAYVDRILKGAKPADLPIEQPTTFELAINLKAAKALGIKFPESILMRADKVIE